MRSAWLLPLGFVVAACGTDSITAPRTVDVAAARASLRATDSIYAAAASSKVLLDAITAPLSPDVAFVSGTQVVRTASGVREVLAANAVNTTARWAWQTVRADVSDDGQVGYTLGYSQLTLANGTVAPGKYLAVWRRQADFSWKMVAYKRVGRPAGDVSLTPPTGFGSPTKALAPAGIVTDRASELAAMMATDRAFSNDARTGVAASFRKYIATDGLALGATAEIAYGATDASAGYASLGPAALQWGPTIADVADSGDLGFTLGWFETRDVKQDGTFTVTGTGQYLTVWRKQVDGTWKFVADG